MSDCNTVNCNNSNSSNPCDPSPNQQESLASQVSNLTTSLFGAFQKTIVNGRTVWTTVCDPNANVPGFPRIAGEGFICYLLRIVPLFQGPPGPTGPTGPVGPPGTGIGAFPTTLVTSSYTILNGDVIIICRPSPSAIVVTLPLQSSVIQNKFVTIWTNGAHNVTIQTSGSDVIESVLGVTSSYVLSSPGESITLGSDFAGTWYSI